MTISRTLTAMTVAVALAAASMGPFAAAASADGWRGGPRGRCGRGEASDLHGRRDNAGKYIAIGVGAFMLGIIAAQTHRPYYD